MDGGDQALVVEGGGMRGVFAAGVLDAFQLADFDPFQLYLGVSAGAINLSSFLAGQLQRSFRLYLGPMSSRHFFSWPKYLSGGHYMDLDWFFDTIRRTDPLDEDALLGALGAKRFMTVCTAVESGQAVYPAPTRADLDDLIKASCALPILYRGPVTVRGQRLVDGGVADAIPVERAHALGARRILVIRSQTLDYQKVPGRETRALKWLYRRQPAIRRTCLERPERYMRAVRFCEQPPAGCRIWNIAPRRPLLSSRTSQVAADLVSDYRQGREAGLAFLKRAGQAFLPASGETT